MTLYQSPNARITYDATNNVLTQTINGYLNTNSLREFQGELVKICSQKKISKIIADTKNQKVLKKEDMDWMIENVIPSLKSCNIKQFAILMPDNIFGQAAVETFAQAAGELEVKIFSDHSTLHTWINA
jgi:hypothetical protein